MKIAELAKKLDIKPGDLRKKIIIYGFDIGKKARTIKDETAEKVEEKIKKEREVLEKTKAKEEAEKPKKAKPKKPKTKKPKKIKIPEVLTVKEFASRLNLPVTDVIKELVKNGVMASINENIDYETATIIAEDLGHKTKKEKEEEEIAPETEEAKEKIKIRPPVVTVIGHIDHGKTSLIDYIRKTKVAVGESGGITQHIGAYQIEVKKGKKSRQMTFLDTPGHEAFVAMREHGTKIADIAILVVAADEGVMLQTKEAISHAKSAGVPIIVAITKIDKPGADIEKVKKQIAEAGLNPEEWGGTTIVSPISAKSGKGVPELLDMILLVSDTEKFKADFAGKAAGVVIESHMDSKRGPVATVLIQKGILNLQDPVVAGDIFGKIKMMEDFIGTKIKQASPSEPVKVYGFSQVSDYGKRVFAFLTDKAAKNHILNLQKRKSVKSLVQSETAGKKDVAKLNLIIKADVAGSLKAVADVVKKIKTDQGEIFIVSASVGGISGSDVMTAEAAGATILGFRVSVAEAAGKLAVQKKIKILTFQVIYELIDSVKKQLSELIGPIKERKEIGSAKVLAIFRRTKTSKIVGVKVTQGKIVVAAELENYREDEVIGTGKISSLKIKQAAKDEVESGAECGIGLEGDVDVRVGDKFKVFEIKEKKVKI